LGLDPGRESWLSQKTPQRQNETRQAPHIRDLDRNPLIHGEEVGAEGAAEPDPSVLALGQ